MTDSVLPPGPAGGALAHTWAWMRRPVELMRESRARFGERFTVRFLGGRSFVFVSAPADVKAIFAAPPHVLLSGHGNKAFAPFLGRHSLLVLDGDAHRRHRRLLMPPFRGERLSAHAPTIRAITEDAVARWPRGETFSMHAAMRALTLTIIIHEIFGVHEAPRIEAIRAFVHEMIDGVGARLTYLSFLRRDLGPWSPWGRFVRTRARLFAALQREIDALRASNDSREDVLALLIRAATDRGESFGDEELHHELLSLLSAGHDTSATALTWAFQYLLDNPDTMAAAVREAVSRPNVASPTELPYLSNVISETVRLMPPIPIVVRYVAAPFELNGFSPPVGTYLAPCPYLAHRDPASFPEPDAFRPDRFADARFPPWIYFPYGGGPRLCVGASFAHHEMVNVLATILRAVDLELVGPRNPRAVRASIVLVPEAGTSVRATGRRG